MTNHRTKDQCILTFKPRGWRGRDAFEIAGYVQDSNGKIVYEIAGCWNKQLIAKAAGSGDGSLHPDASVAGPHSPSATPKYFLLWQNSEKPTVPFNLTLFAITLNDCHLFQLVGLILPHNLRWFRMNPNHIIKGCHIIPSNTILPNSIQSYPIL